MAQGRFPSPSLFFAIIPLIFPFLSPRTHTGERASFSCVCTMLVQSPPIHPTACERTKKLPSCPKSCAPASAVINYCLRLLFRPDQLFLPLLLLTFLLEAPTSPPPSKREFEDCLDFSMEVGT